MPLADGQMQWRGLVLGADPYRLQGVEGWGDLPPLDVGDVPKPTAHGSWAGRRYAQSRTVIADVLVVADDHAAMQALFAATGISGDDQEEPLTTSLWGRELTAGARLERRSPPVTLDYTTPVNRVSLLWTATDPRLYDPSDPSVVTGVPSPPTGLDYPLDYPLSYGSPGSTGSVTFTNDGNADSYPVITISGACSRPSVTHVASGRVVESSITMLASDTLTIDCRAGTIKLNGISDRLSMRTSRSLLPHSFFLPPGPNELAFRVLTGAAASMTARRLSAWM